MNYSSQEDQNLLKFFLIGFSGRFDRYPSDNTMEGDISPKCIVKLKDGHVHCFEIDYEVQLVIR